MRIFLGVAALLLLARMVFMAAMPLTDPSESRYAVLGANMARSGDYMVPRFFHRGEYQDFDGKPPLFFQAGGVACKVFGQNEFAARLPSLLAALLTLGTVFYTMRRLAGGPAAARATVMCGTGGLFYVFAGLCMTDMLLAFCTTGALCAYALFAGSEGRAKKMSSVAFFGFLGLGMLAKGPVAVVLAGAPVFLHVWLAGRWRELARHAWVAGPLVFLALTLPWYARMAAQDPGFLKYFFWNENVLRFVTPDYGDKFGSGHDTFKGMALVWFAVASLPWLPLVVGAGVFHKKRIVARRDFSGRPELALPLLGCLFMTGFWCLTRRALLPYLLPASPLAAMWCAAKLDEWGAPGARWAGWMLRVFAPFTCAVVWIGLGIATWLGHAVSGKMPRAMYREVARVQRETPAYADAKFDFLGDEPYSAEFYLGGAVRRHPPAEHAQTRETPAFSHEKIARIRESVARDPGAFLARAREIQTARAREAMAQSRGDFLLVTKKQMEFLDPPPQRDVVHAGRSWTVFAPVARGTE